MWDYLAGDIHKLLLGVVAVEAEVVVGVVAVEVVAFEEGVDLGVAEVLLEVVVVVASEAEGDHRTAFV